MPPSREPGEKNSWEPCRSFRGSCAIASSLADSRSRSRCRNNLSSVAKPSQHRAPAVRLSFPSVKLYLSCCSAEQVVTYVDSLRSLSIFPQPLHAELVEVWNRESSAVLFLAVRLEPVEGRALIDSMQRESIILPAATLSLASHLLYRRLTVSAQSGGRF